MKYPVGQRTALSLPWPTERHVWLVAIVTYGILDPALTYSIIQLGGVETMAVAKWFLSHFGPVGLVLQKLLIFAVFAAFAYLLTTIARSLDQPASPYRALIAAVIAVRGLQLVVIHAENLFVLV